MNQELLLTAFDAAENLLAELSKLVEIDPKRWRPAYDSACDLCAEFDENNPRNRCD